MLSTYLGEGLSMNVDWRFWMQCSYNITLAINVYRATAPVMPWTHTQKEPIFIVASGIDRISIPDIEVEASGIFQLSR